MFLGPIIRSLTFQWYSFINTKTLIQGEAILTHLIFEHSLRIRFKAEHSDEKRGRVPEEESLTAVAVPETASATEASAPTDSGENNATEEITSSSSASSKGPKSSRSSVSEAKDSGIKSKEKKRENANLIGKLNNLITTDMRNILETRDFLMLCKDSELQPLRETHSAKVLFVPLQISLCCAFLYRILGWRSVSSHYASHGCGLTQFHSQCICWFRLHSPSFPAPRIFSKTYSRYTTDQDKDGAPF